MPSTALPASTLTNEGTGTLTQGTPLTVRYSTTPDHVSSTNWIGIYPDDNGATIGVKNSFTWKYAPNASGSVTLDTSAVPGPGRYAAWYLYNDGYTRLGEPVIFTVTADTASFVMQHQQQTQWCWSATTVSVAAFFNPATAWTQCSMVNAERGLATCCGPAASDAGSCNQPWFTAQALTRAGHLRETVAAALTLDQIRADLLASSPIALRIGWAGGGGHAVVVRGRYSDAAGVEYVSVCDPWDGDTDVPYDTFRNNYRGSGTWTHTYRTKP
ncbi:papain-like cysteine protease family protein [Nonomuraea sp. MTCD27]|uniref:papain-like cysteine protease family protein n=1 Tax=Nonomuraea sp. MTCD27 TaxID=1676747 RepID=UPI0035C1B2EA